MHPTRLMFTTLSPSALSPPSAKSSACTASTTAMHIEPAQGPMSTAASTPPSRCPLVPWATGKLSICTAKMNAAVTAASGTWRSPSWSRLRRVATASVPTATAPTAAEVVPSTNPSGMCMPGTLVQ